MNRKTISALVLVFAISGFAVFASYYLKFQTNLTSKASSPDVPPQNVVASDVTGSSFVVSWRTVLPTTGKIFYGVDSSIENANLTAGDDVVSTSHLVKVLNLKPMTKFYYYICSGDDCSKQKLYGTFSSQKTDVLKGGATASGVLSGQAVVQGSGIAFETSTQNELKLENPPFPVFGQIGFGETSQVFDSVLVAAKVKSEKGMSNTLFTRSNVSSGIAKFSFELSNLRTEDGSGHFVFDPKTDSLIVQAKWMLNGELREGEVVIPLIEASPIKETIKF